MVENEIQFLSWEEFKQMAPSILQLEITRLGTLIDASLEEPDFRNALVRARYEVKQFVTCLKHVDREDVEAACAPHLQAALLTISLINKNQDTATATTLNYVIDRLKYVTERIPLVY